MIASCIDGLPVDGFMVSWSDGLMVSCVDGVGGFDVRFLKNRWKILGRQFWVNPLCRMGEGEGIYDEYHRR